MTKPLKSLAKNCCVSTVPRVAVAGVRVMRMPESKLMLNLPVFFLSALEVAVMVTRTLGNIVWFGNFAGAVKVAGEATVVLVFTTLEREPTALGVGGVVELSVAAVHSAEAGGLGLGTAGGGVGGGVLEPAQLPRRTLPPGGAGGG